MNGYYFTAGFLTVLLGVVHSVLGEILIFRRLRGWDRRDVSGQETLQERHIRTLWSSWHLLTLFGWAMGATFFWMAFPARTLSALGNIQAALIFFGAVFWLIGTRAKHPAWVVLGLISAVGFLGAAT